METKNIKLSEYVSLNSGVTPEEAEPIFNSIVEALKVGYSVVLDFADINMMTTAFLNVMLGTLYRDYTSEQLKEKLSFKNLPDSVAIRIKKVTDNAKLFYKDEKKYNEEVKEALHGSN